MLIILCTIYLVTTLGLMSGVRLDIPISYGGDNMEYNLMTKTMIETGWWMENPRIGAPGILEMYDYPIGNNLDLFIMKIMSIFTNNYAVIMNLYFILGFFLTAICSLYTFRQLKIAYPIGVFGGILFAFMYYHFNKISQYNLLSYYMVPLMVLVILWVFQGELFFFRKTERKSGIVKYNLALSPKAILVVVILLLTSTHSYYAFFGLVLLGVATLWSYTRTYNLIFLLNGVISCIMLAIFSVLNKISSILYSFFNGSSYVFTYRYPFEAEVYGMKLIQLILPTPGHNIPFLANIAQNYTEHRPLVNENITASLGTIATIGFLILLFWVFIREWPSLQKRLASRSITMDHLSVLSIAAVLIGTIGGISAIIAEIFPEIHGYNRISLYISFFAILAICLLLQLVFESKKKITLFCPLFLVFLLIFLSFGIFDQVPAGFALTPGSDREKEFLADENYFNQIEDIMPKGASIFIIPDIGGFPNSDPPGKIKNLDSMKPYLHTSTLKWSYPTMKGRLWDNWQVKVITSSPAELLKSLYSVGFTGLLMDKYGYKDKGAKISGIITNLTGARSFESANGRYAFYDLTAYMEKKKDGKSQEEFDKEKEQYIRSMQSDSKLQNPLTWDMVRYTYKNQI